LCIMVKMPEEIISGSVILGMRSSHNSEILQIGMLKNWSVK